MTNGFVNCNAYQQSTPIKRTFTLYENLKFYTEVLIDIFKVIVLSVIDLLQKFADLVSNPKGFIKSIEGKAALVTGAAHGIGKAIALELARNKCNVIVVDVDEEGLQDTVKELQELGVKAIGKKIDVSDPAQVESIKNVINENGSFESVDILVNNAALLPVTSIRDTSCEEINRITAVNINANFWTVKTFLPEMIKRNHGHIVQICSITAFINLGYTAVYTATKNAVHGFMGSLEEEIRHEGLSKFIKFTTVYPYFVETRKDVIDMINFKYIRLLPVTAEKTAEEIVLGIRRNQRSVFIPRAMSWVPIHFSLLPYNILCHVKDYIARERETTNINSK